MSIESLGNVGASAAGSQRAQGAGSQVETSQQAAANQQRRIDSLRQADAAAGIAETDGQFHQAHDRDADGRRPWEIGPPRPERQTPEKTPPSSALRRQHAGADCGRSLDLTA